MSFPPVICETAGLASVGAGTAAGIRFGMEPELRAAITPNDGASSESFRATVAVVPIVRAGVVAGPAAVTEELDEVSLAFETGGAAFGAAVLSGTATGSMLVVTAPDALVVV